MTFLLPIGLLALLALPLIVALHLVRQRRTRLRVPTTVLWQALRVPPEQRQRTLPLTLLLVLHLLAALALALALANPALLPFGEDIPTHTALLLDTTTSMAATDEAPSRFAAAQAAALAAIDDLDENDTLALVTLSDPPRLLATGGAGDRDRLAGLVRGLAPAGVGADLAGALHIANSTLSTERQQRIVVLTDTSLAAPTAPLSTPAPLEWRAWGNSAPNAAIVAFASRRLPAGDIALYARVANYSDESLARTLRLSVDGDRRDEQTIRVPAGGSEERTWYIPAGDVAELALDGADALPGDDRAVLPLGRARSVRVRLISPDGSALERVLAALPGYSVTVAGAYDPAAPPVDVTVFNGILPETLPPGALIAVNPPTDTVHLSVGPRVSGERANSTALDPAFARIDLSSVQWGGRHPLIATDIPATLQPALTTDTNAPLVLRGLLDDHPAVIWAFDVESSNLPAKLAFPLLAAASLDVLTTGALPPTLPPGALAGNTPLIQPDGRPLPADARLTQPGLYRLRDEQGQTSGGVAVNLGDDAESNLVFRPQPELLAAPAALEVQPTAATGWRMWPLLIWLALAALAAEWIYHGRRGRPARAS